MSKYQPLDILLVLLSAHRVECRMLIQSNEELKKVIISELNNHGSIRLSGVFSQYEETDDYDYLIDRYNLSINFLSILNKLATQLKLKDHEKLNKVFKQIIKERNEIITNCYKWVNSCVRRFSTKNNHDDLVNEAIIGMMRAIDKYDRTEETSFQSYASMWIRKSIMKHIDNNRKIVRQPQKVVETNQKIKEFIRSSASRNSTPITDEQIISALGLTETQLMHYYESMTWDQVAEEEEVQANPQEEHEEIDHLEMKQKVERLFGLLTEKEEMVLRLRYGIAGQPASLTFKQVGDQLGISKQATYKTEKRAMDKATRLKDELN